MKVFISWSGERSKALAIALKELIPLILQYAKPWVSEKDISAGERWAQAISGELESSNFGILCITPENISSEWILFEAGALSKSMLDAKVIPLLFGLELSDLSGPLSQFQALKVDQRGVMDAIKAINAVSENKASEATINQLVPALWSQLQQKIDDIPGKPPAGKHMRPQGEILEELVSQVRGLGSRMRDLDPDFSDRDIKYSNRMYRDLDPHMIDELMHGTMDPRDGDFSLLILAGLVRAAMPWLAEVLVESHRELKNATPKEAREIAHRLMRVVEQTTRGRFGERLMGRTKAGQMLMMDLPMFVDRAVSSRIDFRMKTGEISAENSGDSD
ncbi:toll/interleukin-1 receptor domain-containing protein [Sphingobium yanoikuyae]|uniref:toll/interleukin-1 receptor domain-containing protein n=1 Tax=Sphingobium yanoikuyae TaxID=13690 RepID=UPI0035C72FD5